MMQDEHYRIRPYVQVRIDLGAPQPLPMQPIYRAPDGVVRFRPNAIIEHLYNIGAIDLNALARQDFPAEDRMQLAQLLGYSVSGFGDLSYADRSVVAVADAIATKVLRQAVR